MSANLEPACPQRIRENGGNGAPSETAGLVRVPEQSGRDRERIGRPLDGARIERAVRITGW